MPLDADALRDIEEQTVELAWRAGAVLLEHFQTPLHVEYKGRRAGSAPVTEADRRVEALLQEELARRFPDHAVVGEEGAGKGSAASSLTWALDPLDGTMNFLNGLPVYASSIGLLEEGRPVVGAVFIPSYPGLAGSGAAFYTPGAMAGPGRGTCRSAWPGGEPRARAGRGPPLVEVRPLPAPR